MHSWENDTIYLCGWTIKSHSPEYESQCVNAALCISVSQSVISILQVYKVVTSRRTSDVLWRLVSGTKTCPKLTYRPKFGFLFLFSNDKFIDRTPSDKVLKFSYQHIFRQRSANALLNLVLCANIVFLRRQCLSTNRNTERFKG